MQLARRILSVLLLLAFGLGTPGYAMPSGDISQLAMVSSGDHEMPGMSDTAGGMPHDCGACADDVAMAACVSACLGVQAVLASTGTTVGPVADAFDRLPPQQISGSTIGPDPFPPKFLG